MTVSKGSPGARWSIIGKTSKIHEDLEPEKETHVFPQKGSNATSSDIITAIERLGKQRLSSQSDAIEFTRSGFFMECPKAPPNTPTAILQGRKSIGAISTGDESSCDHLAEEVENLPVEFLVLSPTNSRRCKREGARCPALDSSIFREASRET